MTCAREQRQHCTLCMLCMVTEAIDQLLEGSTAQPEGRQHITHAAACRQLLPMLPARFQLAA